MGLTLKLVATVVDKDANELLLKDTTGAYDAGTNLGGYGATNHFITPTAAFTKYKTWTDTAWVTYLLSSDQLTALLAGTLAVELADIGSTGESFPDGIDQLEYIPLNSTGVNGTFTNGSKIVTLSTTSWNPATYVDNISYVAGLPGSNPLGTETGLLEYDLAGTNNTTQITLKENFTGSTQTLSLWFGPLKDIKVLVNKAAEACIATTLAASSPLDCNCVTGIDKITKMIQWRFTADVLFNCEDYTGAHNTLVQLNKLCALNSSTCNVCF